MKTTTISATVAAALGAAALAGSATACAADPGDSVPASLPPQIRISSVSGAGTGCSRDGSANAALSESRDRLDITVNDLAAEAGPNASLRSYVRFCSLRLDLDVPSNFSYAITSVVHRGYANLSQGVTALQVSRYSFLGARPAFASTSLTGPLDRRYEREEAFSSPRWSPCGSKTTLLIGLTVAISSATQGSTSGQLRAGSSDNPVSLGLSFRPCN